MTQPTYFQAWITLRAITTRLQSEINIHDWRSAALTFRQLDQAIEDLGKMAAADQLEKEQPCKETP